MDIQLTEEPTNALAELVRISIAFMVDRVFDVEPLDGGLAGLTLSERRLSHPYVKDYDAIEGEGPTRWANRFDVTNWGLITASSGGRRVGGAVIALNTMALDILEGRTDLAVLWDIRVAPELRGRGVGGALFKAAEAWALARRCRQFKLETQNVNVAACRFYARQGCVLGAIHRFAYPKLPGEVQLFWYKDIRVVPPSAPAARPIPVG